MKKNLFLKGTAIGLCMAMLTACGASGTPASSGASSSADTQTAATEGTKTLKVGITAPTGSFQFDVLTTLNENLQEVSGGTMNLDIAAGGALGNTAAHYSQMAQGTLDLFCTGFDTAPAMKNADDFSVVTVPFLFNDLDHYKKFLDSDVLQGMIDKVAEPNGVVFGGVISDQAPRALTTTNKPLHAQFPKVPFFLGSQPPVP